MTKTVPVKPTKVFLISFTDRSLQYRPKREHHEGSVGPVHTFVKTDKHANFKWGVRHHVGHKYSGR